MVRKELKARSHRPHSIKLFKLKREGLLKKKRTQEWSKHRPYDREWHENNYSVMLQEFNCHEKFQFDYGLQKKHSDIIGKTQAAPPLPQNEVWTRQQSNRTKVPASQNNKNTPRSHSWMRNLDTFQPFASGMYPRFILQGTKQIRIRPRECAKNDDQRRLNILNECD